MALLVSLWIGCYRSADPIREGTAGSVTQETSNCGPWLRTAGQQSWGIGAVALQLPEGSGMSQPTAHRAEPHCLIGSVVLDPEARPQVHRDSKAGSYKALKVLGKRHFQLNV